MTSIPTIQFYHLLSTSRERAVPSLMQKVLSSGSRAVLLLGSQTALKQMSDALWSHDPASFLPHGDASDGNEALQPIYLTLTDSNPNGANILCILDGSMPESVPGYAKVLDMFDGTDESAVTAARARWAAYKAKGYALQYIRQQPGGSWKMEAEQAASAA